MSHGHPVDPDRVAIARQAAFSRGEADDVAAALRALGDPVRVRVLSAVAAVDEICVGDVAAALGIDEDRVSYAFRQLRAARIVARRRAGRVVYYRVVDERARTLLADAHGP